MIELIINPSYGSFGFSREAIIWLREHGYQPAFNEPVYPGEYFNGWTDDETWSYDGYYKDYPHYNLQEPDRDDPLLLQCIKELGVDLASGYHSKLKIVEIPDDVEWEIVQDETGSEHIAEKHRTWA